MIEADVNQDITNRTAQTIPLRAQVDVFPNTISPFLALARLVATYALLREIITALRLRGGHQPDCQNPMQPTRWPFVYQSHTARIKIPFSYEVLNGPSLHTIFPRHPSADASSADQADH